jgi:serine/threonine protein kinase
MKHEEGMGRVPDPAKQRLGQNFRPPTAPTVVAPQGSPQFELEPTTLPRHAEPGSAYDSKPGSAHEHAAESKPGSAHEAVVQPEPEALEPAAASAATVVPPPPEDPYVGHVIDNRYSVEAVIARGGMGVVYQGRHRVIGKRVAIKVIRTDLVNMPEAPRRFLIEAQAASAIGNEHIIDISDCGTLPDGAAYLVMEYLEGMPLSELLLERQPLPIERLLSIATQLAEGLAAAHRAGIVHRDLKPDNVFIVRRRGQDFVKILDFGIAKMSETGKLTQAGAIVGTPHYMSPEQAAGEVVDHRGDVYSLGVMLYELASGRVPFDGLHCMAVLTKHVQEDPLPFKSLNPPPEVPRWLERIILKCLAKRPEERFGSMEELHQSLMNVRAGSLRPPPPPRALKRSVPPTVSKPPSLPSSVISVPAAPGQSMTPPLKPLRHIYLAGGVAVLSLLSLWRINQGPGESTHASAPSESAAAPAPPAAAPLAHAAQPTTTSAGDTPPRSASNSPAHGAPPPDGDVSAASAAPGRAQTVVELEPGKSVEIEARTKLSLRLERDESVTASPSAPSAKPATTPEPSAAQNSAAAKPARKPKARPKPVVVKEAEAAPVPAPVVTPPPKPSSELMNPWPVKR